MMPHRLQAGWSRSCDGTCRCAAIMVPNSRIMLTIHTNIIFMLDDLRWLLIFLFCRHAKSKRAVKRRRISSVPLEQHKNARRKPLFNGGVSFLFGERPLWKMRLSPLRMYPDRSYYSCDTHHLFEITDRRYALLDIHEGHEETLSFR